VGWNLDARPALSAFAALSSMEVINGESRIAATANSLDHNFAPYAVQSLHSDSACISTV
jgi:hypothetical protein